MLFRVEAGAARVWKAHGIDLGPRQLTNLAVPIVAEPVFGLLDGQLFFQGAVPGEARYRAFFESLGIGVPREMLLIPLHHDDRLMALFFGCPPPGCSLRGDGGSYRRLMQKATLGLTLLAMRQRIHVA